MKTAILRALTPPILLGAALAMSACQAEPMSPVADDAQVLSSVNSNACWGQASKVFAQMGQMGEHASQEETPRLGLRNLARALADAGVIPDDSMASLGAFVASALGLSIDACM